MPKCKVFHFRFVWLVGCPSESSNSSFIVHCFSTTKRLCCNSGLKCKRIYHTSFSGPLFHLMNKIFSLYNCSGLIQLAWSWIYLSHLKGFLLLLVRHWFWCKSKFVQFSERNYNFYPGEIYHYFGSFERIHSAFLLIIFEITLIEMKRDSVISSFYVINWCSLQAYNKCVNNHNPYFYMISAAKENNLVEALSSLLKMEWNSAEKITDHTVFISLETDIQLFFISHQDIAWVGIDSHTALLVTEFLFFLHIVPKENDFVIRPEIKMQGENFDRYNRNVPNKTSVRRTSWTLISFLIFEMLMWGRLCNVDGKLAFR